MQHTRVSYRQKVRRRRIGLFLRLSSETELWNNLPEEVVTAATLQTIVNCFKGRFDRHSADNRYQLKMPNETTIQTLSLFSLDNTLYEDRSTGILAIRDRMMMMITQHKFVIYAVMIMNSKVTLCYFTTARRVDGHLFTNEGSIIAQYVLNLNLFTAFTEQKFYLEMCG